MTAKSMPLDELAVHAFVQEIVDALENVALTAIWAPDGRALWSQVLQNSAADPLVCQPTGEPIVEPVKVTVGNGYSAYHFPLSCHNLKGCVFTLVIFGVDPPNLRAVAFAIGDMLACLSRQIDVDCLLTTMRLTVESPPQSDGVDQELESLDDNDNLAGALQRLADASLRDGRLEGFAIALPVQKILAVSTSRLFSAKSVNALLAKLQKPMSRKRKVVSAKVTLNDGSDGHLMAAPIVRKKNVMQGIVFGVARKASPKLSKSVRTIANRIGSVAGRQRRKRQAADALRTGGTGGQDARSAAKDAAQPDVL